MGCELQVHLHVEKFKYIQELKIKGKMKDQQANLQAPAVVWRLQVTVEFYWSISNMSQFFYQASGSNLLEILLNHIDFRQLTGKVK